MFALKQCLYIIIYSKINHIHISYTRSVRYEIRPHFIFSDTSLGTRLAKAHGTQRMSDVSRWTRVSAHHHDLSVNFDFRTTQLTSHKSLSILTLSASSPPSLLRSLTLSPVGPPFVRDEHPPHHIRGRPSQRDLVRLNCRQNEYLRTTRKACKWRILESLGCRFPDV